ncbi:MAG TPA: hypothetical protein VF712_00865 [Thermoleophilaceae bacterium]|jgi:hypothetical protein
MNALAGQVVRICSVTVVPGGYFRPVSLAEQWLIRFLFVRDFSLPAHHLVNVARTNTFPAPVGGLSIRYDPTQAPAWLSDPWAQGRAGWTNPNAHTAGYDYVAGAQVLP